MELHHPLLDNSVEHDWRIQDGNIVRCRKTGWGVYFWNGIPPEIYNPLLHEPIVGPDGHDLANAAESRKHKPC